MFYISILYYNWEQELTKDLLSAKDVIASAKEEIARLHNDLVRFIF